MSDSIDQAKDGIEQAHHAHEGGMRSARRVAVLISILAAALAISEMGENGAQNEYLTHHITLSDDWSFYQAKTVRWDMLLAMADVLDSLPNAADDPVRQRVARIRAEAARLNDDEATRGRKQLQERATQQTEARDHAFHRYHNYEWVVGGLQIAIVLASVSVVTRIGALWIGAAVLGAAAGLFGLAVAAGIT